MKNTPIVKYWQAFLHWKLWKAIAAFWTKAWQKTVCWHGWKKIFGLPVPVLLVLSITCTAGLIFVFVRGLTQQTVAYILYPLSAYTLTAICAKLPTGLGKAKGYLQEHPKVMGYLTDGALQFAMKLYLDQLINFAYGIFKIVSGVVVGSAWIGSDGIYNLTQALIQLFQILRRKNPGDLRAQWRSYRVCGVFVLIMHLTLTGIVFQMVNWNRAEDQGQIMVIATAVFAFYKFISSFIELAKDRKHTYPIDSSVRMLELSQAIFAIFSLQASLLHTFGTGEGWENLLNTITGCAVCLMVVAMGIYMIRRGNREIRKIQEDPYGK